jgi:hypothetical protein
MPVFPTKQDRKMALVWKFFSCFGQVPPQPRPFAEEIVAGARTSSVRKTFCALNPAGFRSKVAVTNACLLGRFDLITATAKPRPSIRYNY